MQCKQVNTLLNILQISEANVVTKTFFLFIKTYNDILKVVDTNENKKLQKRRIQQGTNEGKVLFNDALNTFYLRLYGVRHMVKDHSHSERGNPLPPHGLLFPISSKGCFICIVL